MRVIGRKPVLELLQSGKPVQRVQIALGTQGRIIGEIITEAKKRKVRVDRVPPEVAKKAFGGGNHQGVVAEAAPMPLHELKDLGKSIPLTHNLLIALDEVTDPHHVGSVARSALAAGCDALMLPARRSAPLTDTVVKTSAGTITRLPVVQVGNLADALILLKKEGWWIHGATGGEGERLWDHAWHERTILVVGSEGRGLSQRVRKVCDVTVQIPLAAGVESLSVSAAAAVILFDLARKRVTA